MSRFYIASDSVEGNNIYIKGDEAHHVLDVIRLKKGDSIITFDGKGREYEGIIKDVRTNEVIVEIMKTKDITWDEKVDITLVQAVPKKAKIDFIIEKATELGVNTIIPVTTSRTIVKFNKEKADSRHNRWKKIAVTASKQCGRLRIPAIQPPLDFNEAVKKVKEHDLAIMACLYKGTQNVKKVIRNFNGNKIIVFIGPEGDFTESEIGLAKKEGCRLVSLGQRVLRVDTAAINIISILQYELG